MSAPEPNPERSWQEIAEEASHEHDPKRLAELSQELERALEQRDKQLKKSDPPVRDQRRAS
jgi:hypothetical protein